MMYIAIRWLHDFTDTPNLIFSELDDNRYEVRKVEEFCDGRMQFADAREQTGDTELSVVPVPPLEEIAADSQFEPRKRTAAEFEAIWIKAHMREKDRALFGAIQRNDVEAVRHLVDSGADVNSELWTITPGAYSPLMFAAEDGRPEIARILLEHGAKPSANLRSELGLCTRTALKAAVANGRIDIVQALLDYGADVNATDEMGTTALTFALKPTPHKKEERKIITGMLLHSGAVE